MTTEPEERSDSPPKDDVDPGWPWSFLLLVGAGALYLILRFVQMFNDYVLN
ncbi:MAG: hypothetical protein BMS9Abin12_2242 [Acidimicrobiia bacterium]|nr:MAG: hypothetical protein BMS9Abin12_2242 [Acidimicrobiia bacterium]